jgi:hypothetical protein
VAPSTCPADQGRNLGDTTTALPSLYQASNPNSPPLLYLWSLSFYSSPISTPFWGWPPLTGLVKPSYWDTNLISSLRGSLDSRQRASPLASWQAPGDLAPCHPPLWHLSCLQLYLRSALSSAPLCSRSLHSLQNSNSVWGGDERASLVFSMILNPPLYPYNPLRMPFYHNNVPVFWNCRCPSYYPPHRPPQDCKSLEIETSHFPNFCGSKEGRKEGKKERREGDSLPQPILQSEK